LKELLDDDIKEGNLEETNKDAVLYEQAVTAYEENLKAFRQYKHVYTDKIFKRARTNKKSKNE